MTILETRSIDPQLPSTKCHTFETAKAGDRVWSATRGWGEIIGIDDNSVYPLSVKYDSGGFGTYTFGGYLFIDGAMQSLFWDEIVTGAPVKPLPDFPVDSHNHGAGFVFGYDKEETDQIGAELKASVLVWSSEHEANEFIRYNHVLADSPLGKFSIEWKGWKDHDSYCIYVDGYYLDYANNLDEAKLIADKRLVDKAHELFEFCKKGGDV